MTSGTPKDFDQQFTRELLGLGVHAVGADDLARGRRLYESRTFRLRWAARGVLGALREIGRSDPSWAAVPDGTFAPKDAANRTYDVIVPASDLDADGLSVVFTHDTTDPDIFGIALDVWVDVSQPAASYVLHVGSTVIARTASPAFNSVAENIRRAYPKVTLVEFPAELNGRFKSPTTLRVYVPFDLAPPT